jgi:hypothetical protein
MVLIRPGTTLGAEQPSLVDLRSRLARRFPGCQLVCFDMNDPLLAEYFVPE